jgi:hypothetical protein
MNKNVRYLALSLLVVLLFISCDKIDSCSPDVNIKKEYLGFKCKGSF